MAHRHKATGINILIENVYGCYGVKLFGDHGIME